MTEEDQIIEAMARAMAPVMARLFNRIMSEQLPYGSEDVSHVARAGYAAYRALQEREAGK